MATGTWRLSKSNKPPKSAQTIYKNFGNPACPCVVYRIHNVGENAVLVNGAIHLEPGDDGDVSGASIEVSLVDRDQSASGTYDLICCCTDCGGAGVADPGKDRKAPSLNVEVEIPGDLHVPGTTPAKIGQPLPFWWQVRGADPQSRFTFTANVFVPALNRGFPVVTGEEPLHVTSPHPTRWGTVNLPTIGLLQKNILYVEVTDLAAGEAWGIGSSRAFDIES